MSLLSLFSAFLSAGLVSSTFVAPVSSFAPPLPFVVVDFAGALTALCASLPVSVAAGGAPASAAASCAFIASFSACCLASASSAFWTSSEGAAAEPAPATAAFCWIGVAVTPAGAVGAVVVVSARATVAA